MTAHIIDFADKKRQLDLDHGRWSFSLDVFLNRDGNLHSGKIDSEHGKMSATESRQAAEMLERLALWIRADANDEDPQDDHDILASINVFSSGRRTIWVQDDTFITDEQFSWLERQAMLAISIIRDEHDIDG